MIQTQSLTLAPSSAPAAARLFLKTLRKLHTGHLTLVTPGGARLLFGNSHTLPGAELIVHDWRACQRIMTGGDIGFAHALRHGWVESPDLTALMQLAIRNESAMTATVWGNWVSRAWYALRHWLRPNTRAGSRQNIHAHYDLGNDFYRLWLDESWTYSSALFAGDFSLSLPDAQAAKYQRVLDMLKLKPGMRVLEIGCGWGGFAHYAAQRGIAVHGVTISPAQLEIAQQRIANAGLASLAQLELRDYRDVTGQYDAVVSIEMFEAVGVQFWEQWFQVVRERLAPGGKALVQSITIEESRFERYRTSSDFIRQYIFPGGMLPSLERFVSGATQAGFFTNNVFAFGKDYAETLRRWRAAFDASHPAVLAQGFDDAFIRTWQLYLAYCEAGFDEGRTDVVQFLLERRD